MPTMRRRSLWLLAGTFVSAVMLGFWLGGGISEQEDRQSGLADFPTTEPPAGSVALWEEVVPDLAPGSGRPPTLEEISEEDRLIASLPMDLDRIPQHILDDIRRIAESENPEGVPPHILEELEEELELMPIGGRAISRMVVKHLVHSKRALDTMIEEDKQVPMPSEDELARMREEADARVPTPDQWRLLGGSPGAQDTSETVF